MHNAPPVVYPVGRFVWGSWLIGALAMLGIAGLTYWQCISAPGPWQTLLAWTFAFASVLSAAMYWPHEQSQPGSLIWHGEAWFWRNQRGHEYPVRVRVLLDGGRFMGLVYAADQMSGARQGPPRFALLCQATIPSLWHGFRCAVYSRPKDDTLSTHQQTSRFEG